MPGRGVIHDYTGILRNAQTIAMIGCSARVNRTSNTIARYLLANSFELVPVNPNYDEVLQRTSYPSLLHIPADVQVDIVNVFRAPDFMPDILRDVVKFADARGYMPVVWTQIGVSSDEAEAIAEKEGIPYVADRCIMVEHRLNAGHVTR